MTVHIARTDVTARELRAAAKSKDARACRRISAIGLVFDGVDRKPAAESSGTDRQALRDRGEGRPEFCSVDRIQL
jgi:hypothetical protein